MYRLHHALCCCLGKLVPVVVYQESLLLHSTELAIGALKPVLLQMVLSVPMAMVLERCTWKLDCLLIRFP